ncbi:MAG TPA: Gfo/Idh/MocA family oxidoreductase [Puia sp.]|jgi:predicted dehydrogenase|nr:Gfo/Idh/MocA family oxidoreductase [Puia sp.]
MSNRRTFIQQGAILSAGALLYPACKDNTSKDAAPRPQVAASDQVNIGAIGLNGMGWADLQSALKVPGVNVVALCDVDRNVLDRRMKDLEGMKVDTNRIKLYSDYRKLLEQKDINVVLIGTPDHWHALIMVAACQAGKDVYVEKPCGNSIGECRAMIAAKNKYNRIVQVGQWQRSQQHFKDAVDFVQSGQLGNIRTVKVWCYQGWMKPAPVVADSAPPAGVDYTMWLGPAPTRPFNSSRFHFNFRWFWDYAGGLMTDWGVHLLDYGLLGMKAGEPKSIAALGGKFAYPDLAEETPDTLTTLYEFDGFNMVWDHAMGIDNGSYSRDHGIAYIGNNATLVLNRNGWEVMEEKGSKHKVAKALAQVSDNGVDKHWENFIAAVRSRKPETLHCPIEDAAHVATVAQLGDIAFRSGERLDWDAAAGKFTDPKVNDAYLMKEYHNGWALTV